MKQRVIIQRLEFPDGTVAAYIGGVELTALEKKYNEIKFSRISADGFLRRIPRAAKVTGIIV